MVASMHPIILVPPLWILLLALCLAGVGMVGLAVVIVSFSLACKVASLAAIHIEANQQALEVSRGVFSREVGRINMANVDSVSVQQSILGRMLGYGTVVVRTNNDRVTAIPCVRDPGLFCAYLGPKP